MGYAFQYPWASLVAQLVESTCNVGDVGSIPGLGRCPGEGKGYPLQQTGLESSTDYTVHGVAKSQTQLSEFHFHSLLVSIISIVPFSAKGISQSISVPEVNQGRFSIFPVEALGEVQTGLLRLESAQESSEGLVNVQILLDQPGVGLELLHF